MSKLSVFILASLALQAIFSEHRVAAQKNVMEILVVVDPETAEWWRLLSVSIGENWNEELYSTFREVNEFFRSLGDYGVDLEIRVKEVVKLKQDIFQNYRQDGKLDARSAMDEAIGWLRTNNKKFDKAVVLVKDELILGGQSYSGYSMQGICQGYSVTLTKANFDFSTARSLVKQIANAMAIDFDGQGKAASCSPDDGYLLTNSGPKGSSNRWSFSQCSARQIGDYIQGKACLKDTSSPSLASRKRFGQVVGAKATCVRKTGNLQVDGYEDKICQYLYCFDKLLINERGVPTTHMKLFESPEGLSCGDGKGCFKGECMTLHYLQPRRRNVYSP